MKPVISDPEVRERMRMAFELYEVAEAMKRQSTRRNHPDLSELEINERVLEWLYQRPRAPHWDEAFFVRREHVA